MLRSNVALVLPVAWTIGFLSLPVYASQGTALQTSFSIDSSSVPVGQTIVTRRGGDIMKVTLHSPKAVRLLSDVDASSSEFGAANASYPLRSGAVLLSLENRPGTYCTPIYSRGLGMAGPCLLDANGDGQFEAVAKAAFTSKGADVLLITPKGKIVGATLGGAQPLAKPIAYATIERQSGAGAEGILAWGSTYKRSDPTRPIKIAFWIDASKDRNDAAVLSQPVQLTFTGAPQAVRIGGLVITVQGFDESGAIKLHVDSLQPGGGVDFGFRNAPVTIYLYMAH